MPELDDREILVYRYQNIDSVDQNECTALPSLHHIYLDFSLVCIDAKCIIQIGGTYSMSEYHAFNTVKEEWDASTLPPLNVPRANLSASAVNN